MNTEIVDYLWIIIGFIFMIFSGIGLVNSRIPVIPFAYLSLLMLQLMTDPPFCTELLLVLFFIGIAVMLLDYQKYTLGEKKKSLYFIITSAKLIFYFFLVALFLYGIFT